MRPISLAVAAVAAALFVPSLAAAQSIQVDNNTTALTLTLSLFNHADDPNWVPCSALTLVGGGSAAFQKGSGCGSFTELKLRVTSVQAGNPGGEPSCYLFNIYWNARVTIAGSETALSCTRVN